MSGEMFGTLMLFLGVLLGLAFLVLLVVLLAALPLRLTAVLLGLAFLVLLVGSLVWLYNDAEVRRKTGCLWLLIAFFTWPLGVIAYLILRDREVRL